LCLDSFINENNHPDDFTAGGHCHRLVLDQFLLFDMEINRVWLVAGLNQWIKHLKDKKKRELENRTPK
jgi:hypothetical protein